MSATPGVIAPTETVGDAIQAVRHLQRGEWRSARALSAQLGRFGLPVRLLALSMRERALGTVDESWQALADAAASCPTERRPPARSAGPGDFTSLVWPAGEASEFWARLAEVGRREEGQARRQWLRIENAAYPKRASLVEACADHLSWVFCDPATWRAPRDGEWLPANHRVTRGALGESGREYYLRRANELHHWVYPRHGSLTRKVWDDIGMYRGLHEAAVVALTEREDAVASGVEQRLGHTLAVDWARRLVNG